MAFTEFLKRRDVILSQKSKSSPFFVRKKERKEMVRETKDEKFLFRCLQNGKENFITLLF